jgi:hypothetical protein
VATLKMRWRHGLLEGGALHGIQRKAGNACMIPTTSLVCGVCGGLIDAEICEAMESDKVHERGEGKEVVLNRLID